jgi:hypothetical protein
MEASRQKCDGILEAMNEQTNTPSVFVNLVINSLKQWEKFVNKFTKPRERGAYTFEDYDLKAFAFLVKVAAENLENETEETLKTFADISKITIRDFNFRLYNFARTVFFEFAYEIKDVSPDDAEYWTQRGKEINTKIEKLLYGASK